MLIIFDCDGVLVDSESLAAEVFADLLQTLKIPLTQEDCERLFRGHTLAYCMEYLALNYPGKLPENFLDRLSLATEKTFAERLKPVEGVKSVLEQLRARRLPFCVASNGGLKKVLHSLSVTGLAPHFMGRCFSAEMVPRGKPAPDLFLFAAKMMNAEPHQTLVVEDSMAGVNAALAAGMRVYCYGSGADSIQNDRVVGFHNMNSLLGILSI
jgi:HAD superfamily hydrolase (TIGR01509 family)